MCRSTLGTVGGTTRGTTGGITVGIARGITGGTARGIAGGTTGGITGGTPGGIIGGTARGMAGGTTGGARLAEAFVSGAGRRGAATGGLDVYELMRGLDADEVIRGGDGEAATPSAQRRSSASPPTNVIWRGVQRGSAFRPVRKCRTMLSIIERHARA